MRKIIITILALLILFIAFLPTFLSTNQGTSVLLSVINRFTTGTIEIESLELNWLGTQKVKNLCYKNKNDKNILSIDEAHTQTSLFSLLIGRKTSGETYIHDLSFTYSLDDRGHLFFPIEKIEAPLCLENGLIILEKQGVTTSYIKNLSFQIDPKRKNLHLKAEAKQGAHQGNVVVNGSLGEEQNIFATFNKCPLTPFAFFAKTKWIPQAFGPELSGNITLTKSDLSIILRSSYLQAQLQGKKENHSFIFSPESAVVFTLTPIFFKEWFELAPDSPLFLAGQSQLNLNIQQISLPSAIASCSLQASFHTSPVTLIYNKKNYTFDNIKGTVQKNNGLVLHYNAVLQDYPGSLITGSFIENQNKELFLTNSITNMPSKFLESIFNIKGLISGTFGEQITINVEATKKEKDIQSNIEIGNTESKIIGKIHGSKVEHLMFSLIGDVPFKEEQKPLFGDQVTIDLKGHMAIKKGQFAFGIVHGNIQNPYLDMDLKGKLGKEGMPFSWDLVELSLKGELNSPPLFVASGISELSNSHPFYLRLEGATNEILYDIDLALFKANGTIVNFIHEGVLNFANASWTLESTAQNLPVNILTSLFPKFRSFSKLLGSYLTFKANISHNPKNDPHTSIDIDVASEGFYVRSILTLDNTLIVSDTTPTILHYELTKERYKAFLEQWQTDPLPTFLLAENATVDLHITQLTCPKGSFTTIQEFICQSGFIGNITISPLTFKNNRLNKQYTLQEVSASIEGEDFSKSISFSFSSSFYGENKEKSPITFYGKLLHLFNNKGELDYKNSELKGKLALGEVPTEFLLGILPLEKETRSTLSALFGNSLATEASLDIKEHKGAILLTINSSNLKAKCPFYLTDTKHLLLTDALDAEIVLTHEINETLIKDIIPILISGIYSNHPLHLHIDPTGFSMALFPFQFRGITVENAYLDIGQIEVVYGGEVQKTMEFLKAKELYEGGIMPAWFTPIYFSLRDGIMEYPRFDLLLAGNVHLAFWGKIDLNKDKVRMTMAIAPSTLQRSFGIKGLTSKQMFHVKMRGSTSNLQLDWTAASRRLSIIIASSAGGQIGSLVGGLIDQIVTSLGERPTPSPTTDPLPWSTAH